MYRLIGALVLLGAPLLWAAEEAKPLPPAEAAKKLNERVTVEMEVKKVGKTKAGDMYFLNNRWLLHNRTAFVDHPEPERRRHLVRLWLTR